MDGRRTVVVSGVPDVLPGRMADKLTIHFQSGRRSRGGDVDAVTFPTDVSGVAFVTFTREEDAARVVKAERQVLQDEEFPQSYSLTVFPFGREVFLYVPRATLDLSALGGDPDSLIRALQSSHRSIRFQWSPQRRTATIEGPFAAVQALREDLVRRAQTAERGETPGRPRSRAGSLSRTSPNTARCQKDSRDEEAALKAPRRLEPPTKHRTVPSEPRHREVEGEAGAALVSSRLDPVLLEDTSGGSLSGLGRSSSRPSRSSSRTGARQRPPDSEDIWVDLNTFRYVQRFHQRDLDGVLEGEVPEGGDLMLLTVSESGTRRGEKLKTLMADWQSQLRCHRVSYDPAAWPSRQELVQICEEAELRYDNVLYVLEDSCIQVVGPSGASLLFTMMVEENMRGKSC
ncbi:uncharacterized protein LOC133424992 [Cololabis saira]|uniref:uncharacterized protein LOC133424992 n=1 Tax=Cololabis saira TaxID=129043 RepID=UPI002AD31ACF|nr:uncharacterized protein LOC133424992 [Cololabis saira]